VGMGAGYGARFITLSDLITKSAGVWDDTNEGPAIVNVSTTIGNLKSMMRELLLYR